MGNQLRTGVSGVNYTLEVPGDKSISHRAIMLGAIASGKTIIQGFLRAEDCLSTVAIIRQLGIEVEDDGETITVHGQGLQGLSAPDGLLDCGNSGTTMRLLSGILAGQEFESVLVGDPSLSKRPMNRVIEPLSLMGTLISGTSERGLPPLTIQGPISQRERGTSQRPSLRPITYRLPVASAQVKSAILLAALYADGTTTVIEPAPSRNHTEEMFAQFGVEVEVNDKQIGLTGGQHLTGQNVVVPGDISSAAFFIGAGLLLKDSRIRINNVGVNQTRTGILDVVAAMGGEAEVFPYEDGTRADIIVHHSALNGVVVEGDILPRLIDEIPMIALLATQANGTTVIKDAQELRVKETDRISAVASQLKQMGAAIEETEDGMIIHGPTPLHGGVVSSFGDHRIGMMLQIAGLVLGREEVLLLEEADSVAISYPTFFEEIERLAEAKA